MCLQQFNRIVRKETSRHEKGGIKIKMKTVTLIIGSIGAGVYATQVMLAYLPIQTFGFGVFTILMCVLLLISALATKEKYLGGAILAFVVGAITFLMDFTHAPASTFLRQDWVTIVATVMVAIGYFLA